MPARYRRRSLSLPSCLFLPVAAGVDCGPFWEYVLVRTPLCAYSRREGEELTYANYFKNQGYVARMLKSGLPGEIKRYDHAALES
jgi:hypothetical protein